MSRFCQTTGWCAVVIVSLSFLVQATAEEPKTTLGERGTLLLEDKFDATELAKEWHLNTGALKVENGVLRASEKASDMHAGAFRRPVPVQNCAVQVDFKLDAGSKFLHVGYDPAAGELKKKGHLFSVIITPTGWSLMEHIDKADPNSKNKTLATAKTTFEPGQTYTLLLECKGDQVVAQIAGKESLKGASPDFHVKKPGLVFRVAGPDDQSVRLDNLKVWELK